MTTDTEENKSNMKPKVNSKAPAKDLCMTPPYAVKPLMDLLQLPFDTVIWESASGEGDLVGELDSFGLYVMGSTLDDGDDF